MSPPTLHRRNTTAPQRPNPTTDDFTPIPTATRPAPPLRRSTTITMSAHNLAMREIIRPWAGASQAPHNCRAVTDSHWTRFSTTPPEDAPPSSPTDSETGLEMKPVPREHLKASVLCAASGTTPDYDASALEREGMPINVENAKNAAVIPIPAPAGDMDKLRQRRQQLGQPRNVRSKFKTNLNSSWSTASSGGSSKMSGSLGSSQMENSEGRMSFGREGIRRVSTCSLLTKSLKHPLGLRNEAGNRSEGSFQKPHVTLAMAKEYGIQVLSASHLENAFEDSDEED